MTIVSVVQSSSSFFPLTRGICKLTARRMRGHKTLDVSSSDEEDFVHKNPSGVLFLA